MLMSAEAPGEAEKQQLPPPPPPPPWLQHVDQSQITTRPKGEEPPGPPPPPPHAPPQIVSAPPAPAAPAAPVHSPPPAPAAQAPASAPEAAAKAEEAPARAAEAKEAAAPMEAPGMTEKKVREYRYMIRILKSLFFPLLFAMMSFWMLYQYVNGFEPYYRYDFNIILGGFGLGILAMNGFVIYNMRVAKREGKTPANQLNGILILLLFLVPYLYYLLLVSGASAWRFSIGFFLSAVITPVIVKAYEAVARGKFYVREEEVDDKLTRTLVFRS